MSWETGLLPEEAQAIRAEAAKYIDEELAAMLERNKKIMSAEPKHWLVNGGILPNPLKDLQDFIKNIHRLGK